MEPAIGVHIHTDQDAVKVRPDEWGWCDGDDSKVVPEVPCVTVVRDHDGTIIERGRKVRLHGTWTLRQYRNPVPCGASTVLLPGPDALYEMEAPK